MFPGKLAIVGAALALASVGSVWLVAGSTAAGTEVVIQDFAYHPADLIVTQGGTVTWVQRDTDQSTAGHGHTATADNGAWDTGPLHQNESKEITFTEAGDYSYHCTIHPGMVGVVRVSLAPGATTTTTARPTPTTRPAPTTTVRRTTTTPRPTTTTTEPPTTTTRRPPPQTVRTVPLPPTTTTTLPPTTTTERLELSSGDVDDDDDGGGSSGSFIVRLLIGFVLAIGGAASAAFIVQRLRGGGG